VRRVEIWLTLHERPFERDYVNVFGDGFPQFMAINPLGRVPALTIESGEHLIETAAIVDYLEDLAPASARLLPAGGEARRVCTQRIACANAIAEKGVALAYEVERRPPQYQWPAWRDRLTTQLDGGLAALEAMVPVAGWMGGERLDGADVAAICAYDFIGTIAAFTPATELPRLAALAARANALPAFSTSYPPRPM
jgi:glutathione S-transferase